MPPMLLAILLIAVAGLIPGSRPALAQTPRHSLRILVFGGTGMIGRRIVDEALRRGDRVTLVVRDPAGAAARANLSVLRGNVLDAAQVARQIADEDIVIEAVRASSTVAEAGQAPRADPTPARARAPQAPHFYRLVARNLVSAARALGVRGPRLLFVGGASSLKDTNGKLYLDEMPGVPKTSEFYTMKEALDYLETVQDVSWTVLTPPLQIAPGIRTGIFRVGSNTLIRDSSGRSSISAEDFAIAMLNEAHHPAHIRARFTVGY